MAIDYNDTRTMLGAIEKAHKPTTLLIDTFFPTSISFPTDIVEMEYRKGGRKMAPFVVAGGKGVNMARTGSEIKTYRPPMMKPKRVITAQDIARRGFGENVYSQRTPADRAAELRALDLVELIDSCTRRQEYMAAQLLINGSYECKGFADDGNLTIVETVTFPEFDNKVTLSGTDTWDNGSAQIYDNIGDISQKIRRNAGITPTVALMSQNLVNYLINNEQLYKYLMVPNRDAAVLMTLQPKLVRPEVMRVGFIQSLNMELYAYDGVYMNDNGVLEQYIPDNHIIIGAPGRGKRLFGAVTQIDDTNQHTTYEGEYIPKYTVDKDADTSALTISSRCVVVPEFLDDWGVIKVK